MVAASTASLPQLVRIRPSNCRIGRSSRHLEKSSHAPMVNVSSLMGTKAWSDSIPYCTANGGLINLTRAWPPISVPAASPSTPSALASSLPGWPRICMAAASTRPSSSRMSTLSMGAFSYDATASRPTSRDRRCFCAPTTAPTSPPRCCSWRAASRRRFRRGRGT